MLLLYGIQRKCAHLNDDPWFTLQSTVCCATARVDLWGELFTQPTCVVFALLEFCNCVWVLYFNTLNMALALCFLHGLVYHADSTNIGSMDRTKRETNIHNAVHVASGGLDSIRKRRDT